ncbi:MAG: AAA family ATPase [Burkholderiaceae bacterium]|nr:AAA family ATPase [Burkholderiaceae bacterium]
MTQATFSLQKLSLYDYRCFAALDIDFHPQLTAIVAANGAGKTSVLDAVTVALGTYLGAFSESKGPVFLPSDIRLTRVRQTQNLEMEYAPHGVHLEAVGTIPAHLQATQATTVSWQRTLAGPTKTKTTVKDAKVLTDYAKQLQEAVRTPGTNVALPLLAYYGTGRLWQQKKLTAGKLPRTSRTIGYTDCLDPASSYKSFIAWFRYWNLNAKQEQLKALEQGLPHQPGEFDSYVAAVAGAVNTCLAPVQWCNLNYSFSQDALVAQHPIHGELAIEQLSDGIQNMIGMVADMAFRAVKLNPQLGAQAVLQTSGIVLIDEVDMHLHPQWQQLVLQGLMQAFPLVQFIVTTHSPQVISTLKRECVRLLGDDTDGQMLASTPLSDTYGLSSHTVLQRVMHVDPQPPVPELAALKQLTQLVDEGQGESLQAQQLFTHLSEQFGCAHEHLQKLQRAMDRQRKLKALMHGDR